LKKVLLIIIFILSLSVVNADECGGSVDCNCGNRLSSSHVMNYDILNCGDDGLVIWGDNIELDCNGHKITGTGKDDDGIRLYMRNNITIKNCYISNFGRGINVAEFCDHNFFINNTITENKDGLYLFTASNNIIESNNISGNLWTGLTLEQFSNNNYIFNNTIQNNFEKGLYVYFNSTNNDLEKNRFCYNGIYDTHFYKVWPGQNNLENNFCDKVKHWKYNDSLLIGCDFTCDYNPEPMIPEFGVVGAGLILVGVGLYLYRRR